MLKINAKGFYVAATLMESLRTKYTDLSADDKGKPISEKDLKDLKDYLGRLTTHLKELKCEFTLLSVDRLQGYLDDGHSYRSFLEEYDQIDWRVMDELGRTKLFILDDKLAGYFDPKEPLFGARVAERFPLTIEEINEAGKCLALRYSQVCVCLCATWLRFCDAFKSDHFGQSLDATFRQAFPPKSGA
jgi:hypothetical protein